MATSDRSKKLASSHQRSWLWGHHAVMETLQAGRWPVVELYVDERLDGPDQEQLLKLSFQQRFPIKAVSSGRMTQLCRQEDHQGLLAKMGPFPYETMDALRATPLRHTRNGTQQPTLYVICDRLQDAHNFGAILRCCDAIAADGIITGEQGQVSVTPHVARASSGAVNHLTLYRVSSLADTVRYFNEQGVTTVAASEKSTDTFWSANLKGSVALVIGSEATGIADDLLELCQVRAGIPMLGTVTSLNAAVAAGILLYECRRQQAL